MTVRPGSRIPDPPRNHLFDGDETNVYKDDVCNLCAGTPGPDLLRPCADMFEEATRHRMAKERDEAFLFQYGATAGPWDFREELSRFLSTRYNDKVYREDLILTCGATHGLQLALNAFVEPDGVIFVEELTYMIAIAVFKDFPGLTVVPVAVTSDGVDVEDLGRAAGRERAKRGSAGARAGGGGAGGGVTPSPGTKPFWAMFYTIPVHHNPLGICASRG